MKIERIVLKKLRGKLSDEYAQKFDDWLNASEKNRKFYATLESLKGQGKDIDAITNLDINAAWEQTLMKASDADNKLRSPRFFGPGLKIAASIAVLLTVGYFSFYYQGVQPVQTSVIDENEITLETSDGKIKVISTNESQEIVDIKGIKVGVHEGDKIVYENEIAEELIYNKLNVPNGKKFDLMLSDGTQVTLNSGSSIKYPVNFIDGNDRLVYLEGEAYFDVSKDSLHPFIVNSNDINIRVLGTQFCVNSYGNDTKSYAVLVEGSISLYQKEEEYDSKNSILLSPNDMASLDKSNGEIQIEKVDTEMYTAWMSNNLVFIKTPFQDILNKIERHFDIDIINNNPELNKYLFTATFTDENLEQVLRTIQRYRYFKYELKENQLIINKL